MLHLGLHIDAHPSDWQPDFVEIISVECTLIGNHSSSGQSDGKLDKERQISIRHF